MDTMVTPAALARKLGVAESTIYSRIRRGKVAEPRLRLGAARGYTASEAESIRQEIEAGQRRKIAIRDLVSHWRAVVSGAAGYRTHVVGLTDGDLHIQVQSDRVGDELILDADRITEALRNRGVLVHSIRVVP